MPSASEADVTVVTFAWWHASRSTSVVLKLDRQRGVQQIANRPQEHSRTLQTWDLRSTKLFLVSCHLFSLCSNSQHERSSLGECRSPSRWKSWPLTGSGRSGAGIRVRTAHGPHAIWKDVGKRLLDDGCQVRTGRLEEDGCWPRFCKLRVSPQPVAARSILVVRLIRETNPRHDGCLDRPANFPGDPAAV
jgi:hypothetical protein